ncbi:MAG: MgtC/SapB family protein [Myxococcales bacterium]
MIREAQAIAQSFPPEAGQILLVLFLSFLLGLEREGHKAQASLAFGGVRTFPLIGLAGYGLARLEGNAWPVAAGLLVVGGLMAVSFHHKLGAAEREGHGAGVTSEVSAILIYVVGAVVERGELWAACTLVVAALLLLELKGALERISRRVPPAEILTFAQFLVLTVVILPVVPNRSFGAFHLNPFKTWLVVVAVTAISYGSYVLQKLLHEKGGVLLTAVLGGAYSSTLATVTLAKKANGAGRPHLFAGGMLVASGMMYLRLALLVTLFSPRLSLLLAPAFCALGAAAGAAGWAWSRRSDSSGAPVERDEVRNPLELSAAFLFALLFVAMVIVTQLALEHFGTGGVFGLAAIMGVTDVDPFILSVTQSAGSATPLGIAGGAIAIAAASNNVVKGLYARSFGDRTTGNQGLALLAALALAGLIPLFWAH